MEDKFGELEREYNELTLKLSDHKTISNPTEFARLSKRFKTLETLINTHKEINSVNQDIKLAHEMYADSQGAEDKQILKAEIESLEAKSEILKKKLQDLLIPVDPYDGKNVIITVKGAEGGEEANLFAKDLVDMYLRYCERKKWKIEMLGYMDSERGGVEEATFLVKGNDAWRHLKHEAGPHRVQRVPVTESSGRIHTSSATVTVLPETEEIDIEIDPADLKIDVFRSTGPGGQSVNTTDSAVRITHLPTGTVVSMQEERSQTQNREKALKLLRSKLMQMETEKQMAQLDETRRSQVGKGGRSEKIRTYNFKENRVTDHRINLTLYKLDKILQGELDELSDALVRDERTRQLQEGGIGEG
jgi:peptide chain release factor 1